MISRIFTHRNLFFVLAVVFQAVALILMATDDHESGFGIQTLWIAPPLFLFGLLLPVFGLLNPKSLKNHLSYLLNEPLKPVGALLIFFIAMITYGLTLEPTASLWDCSEMIAAAYKLQVPHTPGTPLTLLVGRLFSMMALGDTTQVAWFVNLMSAFFSALAVVFTFLITWYFGTKLTKSGRILILGSLGGAMCLTFSDSFWFSAVEAETYGISIFFMVFMLWLSIRVKHTGPVNRERGILLLAYLAGLSYCIHPMCILILPICVFFVWNRKGQADWKNMILSLVLGVVMVLFISKVVAVDLFEWAFQLDLLLVNRFSLPFYSGVYLLIFLLSGFLGFMWFRFGKSRMVIRVFLLLIFGFSPYLMMFVRSAKRPPINEFSPNDLAMIKPYMNRESYPSRPLLYGPYFDAKINDVTKKASSYVVKNDQYEKEGDIPQYQYDERRMTILPRIYSDDPAHIATYQEWTELSPGEEPKFSDNLTFMIRYQLGHMYGRYLMWNFAGRVSDTQHAGWMAPWEGSVDRNSVGYNEANNQLYMLPFLLGLLGMYFQSRKDKKGFVANLSFFLITGFLLVIYLNATPNEPRERDYIYVGSYTAFSIWIGLGIMSIGRYTRNWMLAIPGMITVLIPTWMLYQNLDDHDRSGRTFQMDHARNVLGSCEQNAILFTGGDNDTFPLWYLQEVEGFRTDVRVKVLSYFNADWYINQLTRPYYDSPPFKLMLLQGEQYGPYNPLYIRETMDKPISWSKYMQALSAQNPGLMIQTSTGSQAFYLPSKQIRLSTSEAQLEITVKGSYLKKNELAILDLVQSNDWQRPVYFNFTALHNLNINLRLYLRQKGLVYQLVPERSINDDITFDVDKCYQHLIKGADYSNLKNPEVYFNHEDYQSRMILPLKFTINSLIEHLMMDGNSLRAKEVTIFANKHLYFDHLEPSYADLQLGTYLNRFSNVAEANNLLNRLFDFTYQKVEVSITRNQTPARNDLIVLQESARLLNDEVSLTKYQQIMEKLKSSRSSD